MSGTNPTICIYHGNCADGFSAAWAVWRKFGDAVRYHAGVYGDPPPDVTGQHVLLVDFSYKAPVLREMAAKAASVTVLDHHKTAEADLSPLLADGTVQGVFDMERSGAVIAWQHFHSEPVPVLLQHVQDRDLWRFKLEGTREIQACVFSHPYDFTTWSWLAARCDFTLSLQEMIAEGGAIERKHFKDIEELLKQTARPMVIGGVTVQAANLPYTMSSDAAGKLAEGAPFGACYFDRNDGQRIFSLRSRGEGAADVSEIAKRYGGGGHRNAAGFQMPIGWEGDVPVSN